MSRASSWAWRKCRDISAESLFPSPSCNHQNCSDNRKSLPHQLPGQPKNHISEVDCLVKHGHSYGLPSTQATLAQDVLRSEKFNFVSVYTFFFFFCHCMVSDRERSVISSLWKALAKSSILEEACFRAASSGENRLREPFTLLLTLKRGDHWLQLLPLIANLADDFVDHFS
ncbi:Actin-Related Protein 10 [Manis pentadactyla]|nr:Actin-Related Protein 10 [Manis pentadactyla]